MWSLEINLGADKWVFPPWRRFYHHHQKKHRRKNKILMITSSNKVNRHLYIQGKPWFWGDVSSSRAFASFSLPNCAMVIIVIVIVIVIYQLWPKSYFLPLLSTSSPQPAINTLIFVTAPGQRGFRRHQPHLRTTPPPQPGQIQMTNIIIVLEALLCCSQPHIYCLFMKS